MADRDDVSPTPRAPLEVSDPVDPITPAEDDPGADRGGADTGDDAGEIVSRPVDPSLGPPPLPPAMTPQTAEVFADRPGWEGSADDVFAAEDETRSGSLRAVIEWLAVVAGALVAALVIKTFLFQAFYIPSGSMEPALQIGDRVLVNKLSYDLGDIERGDIIVFHRPEQVDDAEIAEFIKRVIGLPGDRVEARDGVVHVNGVALDEDYLAPGTSTAGLGTLVVPADQVLVLGDNRSDSTDGRVFGPIPVDDIVGQAFVRVWPLSDLGGL